MTCDKTLDQANEQKKLAPQRVKNNSMHAIQSCTNETTNKRRSNCTQRTVKWLSSVVAISVAGHRDASIVGRGGGG